MEKSLNSSRNFKLPPIQGAVPAANILRQPPPTTRHTQPWRQPHDHGRSTATTLPNRTPVKPRTVSIHVPQDPFPGRYRSPHRNLSTAASLPRRDYATILNEKNAESKLDFTPLRHQFPQSYSVLPPIQKIKEPSASESQGKPLQDRAHRSEKGQSNLTDANKSVVNISLPNERQKRDDVRKLADHNNNNHKKNGSSKTDTSTRSVAEEKGSTKRKNRTDSQDKETGERKPSATTLLFLKGKRKGRRVGVCLENEPALINVTEQLKEIFLRRNMEEMYLI